MADTGFSMKVTIKDREVEKKLTRLLSKMSRPAGFYRNVGDHIEKETPKFFKTETAPDGTAWQPLSPVTLALREKRGTGSTIYREHGDFIGTLNYNASADNFTWGSADVRANIFQHGGKTGRGHKVTLPARPYLGISPGSEKEILRIAENWVALDK